MSPLTMPAVAIPFRTPPVLKFTTSGLRSDQASFFRKYTPTSVGVAPTGAAAAVGGAAAPAGAGGAPAGIGGAALPAVIMAWMTLSVTPADLRAIKSSAPVEYRPG